MAEVTTTRTRTTTTTTVIKIPAAHVRAAIIQYVGADLIEDPNPLMQFFDEEDLSIDLRFAEITIKQTATEKL